MFCTVQYIVFSTYTYCSFGLTVNTFFAPSLLSADQDSTRLKSALTWTLTALGLTQRGPGQRDSVESRKNVFYLVNLFLNNPIYGVFTTGRQFWAVLSAQCTVQWHTHSPFFTPEDNSTYSFLHTRLFHLFFLQEVSSHHLYLLQDHILLLSICLITPFCLHDVC